jgi:methylated-DNA-[protein]-cysteine S-methyltransferase
MHHRIIDTAIGELTLVGTGETLTGVYFPGHWTKPDRDAFGPVAPGAFAAAERQLDEYLSGARTGFALDTRAVGVRFQQEVWRRLRAIPYGETRTYGEIAAQLGKPGQARAVGHAVGHNQLSLIVPCHRVVGKNGSLTGYAGGLERKRFLLALEGGLAAAS